MLSQLTKRMVVSCEPAYSTQDAPVVMSAQLLLRFLQQARHVHAQGLKSYGIFAAAADSSPLHPTDVYFFDAEQNRRNSPPYRAAFEAQGTYFRAYDDAGFVADAQEVARVDSTVTQLSQTLVAPFHSHRRQPPNFSEIDYRLHNPLFSWHLVVCLRNPAKPELQPFLVDKGWDEFGIDASDEREGSECAYQGENVRPLDLVVEGSEVELDEVVATLGRAYVRTPVVAAKLGTELENTRHLHSPTWYFTPMLIRQ